MIYEFRTYTLHPRTLPEFIKRWTDALEPRLKLSPLAAFWYTEIGPLNQAIHVWPYENTLERSKIRAEAVKRGIWPPKTSELIAEMKSEIFEPLPFSPPLAPSNQGPYFEMRTYVLKPGGILAVRDVDYGGVIWSPASSGLDRWLELYHDIAWSNGGEPDAGRHLKRWVREAGFADIEATATTWVFSTALEREWWGGTWAERATQSQFAAHAIEAGHSDPSELERVAQAWRDWAADDDGWLLMPHGEVLARA